MLSDPHLSSRLLDSLAPISETSIRTGGSRAGPHNGRNINITHTSDVSNVATRTAPQPSATDASAVRAIAAAGVPGSPEERAALMLEWAYFEAVTLVRQHADVLERVREYLAVGTSSVGETALLIDDMLC